MGNQQLEKKHFSYFAAKGYGCVYLDFSKLCHFPQNSSGKTGCLWFRCVNCSLGKKLFG